MQENNKFYTDKEIPLRYANFLENLNKVEAQNKKNDGLVYGLNQYSDMSASEFKKTVLMQKTLPTTKVETEEFTPLPGAPATFDWRDQKLVTPVKNQGSCGSCWAFSATEAIESSWIKAGKATAANLNLSPQQIVDCDKTDSGCGGGWPEKAMKYIIGAGGQEGISHYPYTAKDGSCNFIQAYVEAKISSYAVETKQGDETTLQDNLVKVGPLSVCVDAAAWQTYKGGIMTPTQCCTNCQLDHCVQLVGYNTTSNPKYWILRNSWGEGWGINGYIYLQMGGNTCGITDHVYWPFE